MSRGDTRRALRSVGAGLRELARVRWVRVAAVLAVIALGIRAGLNTLLARTLDSFASERELQCVWDDLDLSLLTGRAELRHLRLGPRADDGAEAPEPFLELEYAVFDLEILPLFSGNLRVLRAEIDGLDSRVERDEQGAWNFERHVAAAEVLALLESKEGPAEDAPADETRAEPEPLDLSLPVAVDALRFQNAHLTVADRSLDEPLELTLELNAALSYLNTSARPARFWLTMTGGDALDGASVEGEVRSSADALGLTFDAHAGGLRPGVLAPYLALLGLRPAAETLEARGRGEVTLEVVGKARDELRAGASFQDFVLAADGEECLALDSLTLGAERLGAARADLGPVAIRGARGRLALLADGALRAAGLDLLPSADGTAGGKPAASPPSDPLGLLKPGAAPRWATLFLNEGGDAFPWTLAGISIEGGSAEVVDHTTSPATRLALECPSFTIGEIVHDPAREPEPIAIAADLVAPGVAESITVRGSLLPLAPERSLELSLALGGIGLEAVDPYLERAGLEPAVEDGTFQVALTADARTDPTGKTTAQLEVREVALTGERELFGVRSLAVRDLVVDPGERVVRVGDVEIDGPKLALERDPSHELLALGLRVLGRGALRGDASTAVAAGPTAPAVEPEIAPETAPGTSLTEPAADALPPPRVILDRVAWVGSDLSFLDRTTEPPTRIALDELGFELSGLVLGGAQGDPEPEAATFRGRLVAAGIASEILLDGTVRSRPGPLDLEAALALRGTDLRAGALAPYMRSLGLEPVLESGALQLDVQASVRHDAGVLRADVALRDALFSDGGRPLLGLDRLELAGVAASRDGLAVDRIAVLGPTAYLSRDAEGRFGAAGMRLVPPPAAKTQGMEPAVVAAAPPAPLALPALPPLRVGEVVVDGASLVFVDGSLAPPFETDLGLAFAANGVDTRGTPGTFTLRFTVEGSVEELSVAGDVAIGDAGLRLDGTVTGRGLREGAFGRFLPPGLSFDGGDGLLSAHFATSVTPAADGGLAGRFELTDARWGTPEGEPWLGARRVALAAKRIDPVAGTIELGDVLVEGAVLSVERDESGALRAFGARVAAHEPGAPQAPDAVVAVEAASPAAEADAPAPRPSAPPPRIHLTEGVSLELERFTVRDATLGADARPITGRVRLAIDPAVIVDPDPEDLPPVAWRVEGALDGLVDSWSVSGSAAPFAAEPRFTGRFVADGVRTAGLVELVPELGGLLVGEVDGGRLEASMEATLAVRRAQPYELGTERPFSGEARLAELYFRDSPEGEILLGIDAVQVEIERVDPARGLVHVESVEVETPHLTARRDAEGLHALGLLVPLVEPEAGDGESEDTGAEPEAPSRSELSISDAVSAGEGANVPEAPAGELRVDRFTVTGLAVDLRDDSVDPPAFVPLDELDLEVRRFTTRAFSENRAVSFNAFLAPAPAESGPPVFDEVVVSGRAALYPAPKGWARLQIAGLELTRFSGLAAEAGLGVEDGALDTNVRVRFLGDEGVRVDTSLVFTDLDLEEPEGGVVESTFALPMALDTALFLLRSPSGEHRFSLGITLDPDGVSAADIGLAATAAMTKVLASALAGAPVRLLTAFVPTSDEPAQPREVLAVPFHPGATSLAAEDEERLRKLGKRLAGNERLVARVAYELGTDDLARAEILANPSASDCLELTRDLRRRKAELGRRLDGRKLEARALYAIGSSEAKAATLELRALETELAGVERSLDQVLEVLRSDSPRQQRKRTRTVARELAELRVAAVTDLLVERLHGADSERIEVASIRVAEPGENAESRVRIELIVR